MTELLRARTTTCVIAVLLLAYALLTWRAFSSSGPQTAYPPASDTIAYVRMASLPVLSRGFLAGERCFVYPLFLKMAGSDLARAGSAQTLLAISCWGFLALSFLRLLVTPLGRVVGVALVLLCALREEILFWNGVSLSESLSCSLFALWAGSWIMFARGSHWFWKLLPLLTSFLFAFVRDSDAFLVLGAALVLAGACAIRTVALRYSLVSLALLVFFVGSQASRSSSFRSKYSLQNIMGGRILTERWRVDELRRFGMPLAMSERDYSFFAGKCGDEFAVTGNTMQLNGRPGAAEFGRWIGERHYGVYLKFLLFNPTYLLFQPFREDGPLVFLFPLASWVPEKACNNDPLREALPPGFRSPVPAPINRVLGGDQPAWVLSFWGVTAALSIAAFSADEQRRGRWFLPGVLLAASLPHLLVVWHGDAMDVPRHALLVGIQVHLSLAMFAALAFDSFAPRLVGRPPGERGRVGHQRRFPRRSAPPRSPA